MIDDQTAELACLYVLDLLETDARASFELQMSRQSELSVYVLEISAALHASYAEGEGEIPSGLVFDDVRKKIETPTGPVAEPSLFESSRTRDEGVLKRKIDWAWTWGVAACLMFLFNLFLISGESGTSLLSKPELVSELEGGERSSMDEGKMLPRELVAKIERLESQLKSAETRIADQEENVIQLMEENNSVKENNTRWKQGYSRLAARFLPFFKPQDGLSRYTVIELVDGKLYDQEVARKGFTDYAGQLLTGQAGSLVNADPGKSIGPVGSASTLSFDGALVELTSSNTITPISFSDLNLSNSNSRESSPAAEIGKEAVGLTVWRDDQQQGFLEIYNLPEPDPGREAILWVRASPYENYVKVGKLPELDNGNGSIYYNMTEENFTPSEILISSEVTGTESEVPGKEILLRGP